MEIILFISKNNDQKIFEIDSTFKNVKVHIENPLFGGIFVFFYIKNETIKNKNFSIGWHIFC